MSKQKKAEYESSQSSNVIGRKVAVMITDTSTENSTVVYKSLIEFTQSSPLYILDELEFQRDQSLTREMQW